MAAAPANHAQVDEIRAREVASQICQARFNLVILPIHGSRMHGRRHRAPVSLREHPAAPAPPRNPVRDCCRPRATIKPRVNLATRCKPHPPRSLPPHVAATPPPNNASDHVVLHLRRRAVRGAQGHGQEGPRGVKFSAAATASCSCRSHRRRASSAGLGADSWCGCPSSGAAGRVHDAGMESDIHSVVSTLQG